MTDVTQCAGNPEVKSARQQLVSPVASVLGGRFDKLDAGRHYVNRTTDSGTGEAIATLAGPWPAE